MASVKVLVVDDDQDILRLVEKLLGFEGYQVFKATGGEEVMGKIRALRPQLVIMDIMMPDKYGSEVVQEMNSDPLMQDLPIIFLSGIAGDAQQDESRTGIKIGEKYYPAITKPFDPKELVAEVKKALSPDN